MLTNSKIALAVALVLATASAAVAAPKHPVRHDAAIQRQAPANVLINRPPSLYDNSGSGYQGRRRLLSFLADKGVPSASGPNK